MTKILIDRAVVEQALETLERIDQADNDCDFLNPSQCYQLDEAMIALRAALTEQPAEQEPVAAQHRFRHSQKGTPDWSVWQPCKVAQRPAWEVDSQGYEVEYRALYTAPQPRRRLTDEDIDNTTRKQVDDLLDHIYEYGTAAEGIDYRVRAIARAIERAHGIGEHE